MTTIEGQANAVVQWDANSGAALPAYLANALDELGTNIADRSTVPSLSYEGKTWTIVMNGNKTKLQSRNQDGDMVPISIMRMVILQYNADRGRAYYEGVYNPSAAAAPKCWSPDGKAPDASVKEKQSSLCQGCPMSVKGSKVQDGKEMVACSSHRMIAIAPASDLTMDPLRLKIAVTSDYDKEVVEHGWFAFRQYTDWLKSRGISHTALVVTKVKFDMESAFPKLLFALDRPLSEAEVGQIKEALKNPKVPELLAEKWTAAGTNGTPINDSDIKPHGLEGAYADGWQAHPEAAGYSWRGAEVLTNEALAALYPAPEPAPEPTAPPIPASEQVIDQSAANAPAVIPAVPTSPEPVAEPIATGPVWNPIEEAEKAGWIKHPTAPDYHYLGDKVVLSTEVAAMFPAPAAIAAPAAPPAPPAAPVAPAVPTQTPRQLAEADGWVLHPTAPDYLYKGEEVVLIADVEARYGGNGSAPAATAPTGATGAGATTDASPTDGAVPAEVQNLLDKWTT
jgi:hypothetical protein